MRSQIVEMILEDLALCFVPNLGTRGVVHLLEVFGNADRIYSASEEELRVRAKLRPDVAHSIAHRVGFAEAERELYYAADNDIEITAFGDALYPRLLGEASDRPHIIYSLGDVSALNSPHILSVVGTRRITPYGEKCCYRLIRDLAEMFSDLVVVSGLAFGVDAAAHHAAIDGSVRTVGVVANPLPKVTPAQHTVLAKGIVAEGGAIISELPSATKQNGNYYIPRNRIIAAVAEGLLIVESPANGGSLSTVQAADSYARTIMAVPGRIGDAMSVGTNHLIKSNLAHLVTSAEDIAAALGWQVEGKVAEKIHYAPREASPLEEQILACFVDGGEPVSLDEIALRCAITTAEASAILLDMELSGVVRQLPGKYYDKTI